MYMVGFTFSYTTFVLCWGVYMYTPLAFLSLTTNTPLSLLSPSSLFQQIERKVEGIRNGAHVTGKKLTSSLQGSGSTPEKHQVFNITLSTVGSIEPSQQPTTGCMCTHIYMYNIIHVYTALSCGLLVALVMTHRYNVHCVCVCAYVVCVCIMLCVCVCICCV